MACIGAERGAHISKHGRKADRLGYRRSALFCIGVDGWSGWISCRYISTEKGDKTCISGVGM